LNALVASFGAALVDRAILEAVCRASKRAFAAAVWKNVPAIDATLAPGLRDFGFDAFLDALVPSSSIAARHTVGLVDPLTLPTLPQRT